jgi:type IV fimbrial biogenesis protein FimT
MERNRGFTLVELMVVIVVAAIGITLAVPSFRDLIERKAVGGAAEAAYEQLQAARSQAVKRSKPILVDFHVGGTSWAIGFTDKLGGCNAESTTVFTGCTVDYDNDSGTVNNFLKRIEGADYKNITMSQATGFSQPGVVPGSWCTSLSNDRACFGFVRGIARSGAYDFDSANYKLRVQVSVLGNIEVCVPSGEKKIVGYDDC